MKPPAWTGRILAAEDHETLLTHLMRTVGHSGVVPLAHKRRVPCVRLRLCGAKAARCSAFRRHIKEAIFLSFVAGVDVGSMGTKAVLYDGALVDAVTIPTGWNSREAAERALGELLAPRGLSRGDLGHLVATGYGRGAVAEADARITEITCHALGAAHLFPKVRFVLDIGGQDSKVIALDGAGRVTDFLMNDKCAAGTGRFLQVMAAHLEYELEDFSRLPDDLEPLAVSSMCTVFAESEVVGLLAGGADKAALALGLLDAVAGRACGMLAKLGVRDAVAFTGGVSKSRNLAALLERRLGLPVLTSPHSQIAGALGAALAAFARTQEGSGTRA